MPIQRRTIGISSVALCLAVLGTAGLAQSPQPTFRSTVDLLTIETSVRDKSGQVVSDLQASDFTVTINGKPRKVVSAVFFKADASGGARLTGGAAPTPQYVSNDRAQPGRVVFFALDSETIRGGQERALFDTASRMLDGLSPADAVGLVEMPGVAIDVTRDHTAVAEALKRFRGRARTEAEEKSSYNNLLGPVGVMPFTLREQNERAHAQRILLDLARLARQQTSLRAPRSIILISGGLKFDRELMAQYKELQRAAAESRVVLYSVLLEQVGDEVSRGETRPEMKRPPGLVEMEPSKGEGLATIGSMTGGMFFNAAGKAGGIFDRIQSEVSSFYQLALESSPADADGKEHDVKVRVNRTGLDVRAPAHVAVGKPPKTAPPRDRLAEALQQPTDVPDVPLAVTTYSTHGASGLIQVLLSAEVGAPNAAAPVEWAYAISQPGKEGFVGRGRIPAGSSRPQMVSTSVELQPGAYRLRVAAVDAEDRIGVLDVPFTAGYQTAAGAMLSDLVVGVVAGGQFEPRRRLAISEDITAILQIAGGSAGVTGGVLQLIPAGSARPVLSVPLSIRPSPSADGPTTLQAQASLASVPPGRYTASAALQISGQPSTRTDRVIEIK